MFDEEKGSRIRGFKESSVRTKALINLDKIGSICEAWPRNQPSVNQSQRVAMKNTKPHFSR
jgi:hypothetical protein